MVNKRPSESRVCPFHATCSRTSSLWSTTAPTPRPLRAEGTIATRLTIAIIQKMVCIGPMNRSLLGAPDGSDKPAKMACKTLIGMLVARTAKRSEEHTSELQSRLHLVCRLLLEKKKKEQKQHERARSIKENYKQYRARQRRSHP